MDSAAAGESAKRRIATILRDSEESLRALVDSAPHAICVLDTGLTVICCNEAASSLLGSPCEDDLVGHDLGALLPDEAYGVALEETCRVAEALEDRQAGDLLPSSPAIRCSMRTIDGRCVPIERTITGVMFDGEPALMFVMRDVTEEARIERDVHESHHFLERLLSLLDAGVLVIDGAAERVVSANEPAERIFGYAPGEMVDAHLRELHVSEDDFQRLLAGTENMAQLGESHHTQMPLRAKDGRVFEAEVSVRALGGENHDRIVIVRDVTMRTEVESQLRDSELRFRQVVQEAPFGLLFYTLTKDDELEFAGSNPAADEALRFEGERLLGTRIEVAFPGLAGSSIPDDIRRIAREGGAWHLEQFAYRDDRLDGVYDVNIFGTGDRQVAIAFRDITERVDAERRERQYVARLSAMAAELAATEDRERRRLAEDLHDRVGQALAVARMRLHQAQAEGAFEPEDLETIGMLLDEAIRETRALTTELFPPFLYELGLPAALQWLCDEFDRLHGLRCVLHTNMYDADVDDETKAFLFRATRELLMNVVKHAKTDSAYVGADSSDGVLRLTVEDDGVGFDVPAWGVADAEEGAFGLFSISDRLLHMRGGIDIRSTVGHGTRIGVEVPLEPVDE